MDDFEPSLGLKLQLGTFQSLYYYKHSNYASFIKELCSAKIFEHCNTQGLSARSALFADNTAYPEQTLVMTEIYTDGLEFERIDNGNAFAVKSFDGASKYVTVPSSYMGLPITAIGKSAFRDCDRIEKVKLPDTIDSIGQNAFKGCENLLSISIPNGITKIENMAFEGCKRLINFTLPASLEYIGRSAFEKCESLTSVVIPSHTATIDNYAFENCVNLKEVLMSEGVRVIGGRAFKGCACLINVVMPQSITSIGFWAFYGCRRLKTVTIPSSVTEIREQVFDECDELISVFAPKHLVDALAAYGKMINYYQSFLCPPCGAPRPEGKALKSVLPLG